ncbi:P-loop containing nucleoside triphosphate hydrolases superfamily protein [Klebsormidium nitens]|uniref:P-loop containing nucleoside triphosphate hydrolases superfamily protein n=1 Tax=Klebsormidium nitens TaxID=105231 RepID=A0A1Y1I9J2_KLENI|nr:P-loop containing nucleoside triphosphate hydrolases superfamily protein [Klebsormidium nitens]|eukprot:GAQ86632.1 P-loop containing nucleoside triphosphate hydrolases superfamily protein [Klebsormidium nitens]
MALTLPVRRCLLLLTWVALAGSLWNHRRCARESMAPSQEPVPWSVPSGGIRPLGEEPPTAVWRGGEYQLETASAESGGEAVDEKQQRRMGSIQIESKANAESVQEENTEAIDSHKEEDRDTDKQFEIREKVASQETDNGEERTEEQDTQADRSTHEEGKQTDELSEDQGLTQRNASTCPPAPAGGPPRFYPAPRGRTRAPTCACTPVAPFILLSMQRSGSGWFETLLNSHPHVRSHGEVFSKKTWRGARERARLDDVYNLGRVAQETECLRAVGFKWMLNQGVMDHWQDWLEYVRAHGVSVVVLFRRNTLRRMVSVAANGYDKQAKLVDGEQHKSHVHSAEEAEKLAEYKPELDPRTLVAKLRSVQATQEGALRMLAGTRHVVLYYEDVVADPSMVDRVQDFLGVAPRPLRSKQVPIHTQGLEHHVANWDQVAAALAGTPYEAMLYE